MLPAEDLRRLHGGDQDYFAILYTTYTPRFRTRLLRVVSAQDVDDVLHDSWERVYRRRATFTARGALEGWLWHICRNTCIDFLRHERVLRLRSACAEAPEAEPLVVAVADDSAACSAAVYDWLLHQIADLKGLQAKVATLRWLYGLSTEAAAIEAGVAPGTVKAALFQVRQKLRRQISLDESAPFAEFDAAAWAVTPKPHSRAENEAARGPRPVGSVARAAAHRVAHDPDREDSSDVAIS